MKHLLYSFILFASTLFFSTAAIIGKVPVEGEPNSFYKYYCILVFGLFFISYLLEFFKKGISRRHFISMTVMIVYMVAGILSGYFFSPSCLSLVAYGIPAVGIAVYYSNYSNINQIVKWIDIFLPIIAISLLFSLRLLIRDIIGGTGYYSQDLSYYASYCFVFYLFMLLFGNNFQRFKFFSSKLYRNISICMLPYSLVIVFFAGGRGAFGTIAIGSIILLYVYHKRHIIKVGSVLKVLSICTILLLLFGLLNSNDISDIFTQNISRVFSFFNKSIDMYDRTSGRDEVMTAALNLIKQNPFTGYGLFSYKGIFSAVSDQGYPHNFFLEVLLQGGILFFVFVLIVLMLWFAKLVRILRDNSQIILLPFVIIPMTMLLYSGSYMENAYFWFVIMYVFNYRIKKRVIDSYYE